jgi:hypothetical protein
MVGGHPAGHPSLAGRDPGGPGSHRRHRLHRHVVHPRPGGSRRGSVNPCDPLDGRAGRAGGGGDVRRLPLRGGLPARSPDPLDPADRRDPGSFGEGFVRASPLSASPSPGGLSGDLEVPGGEGLPEPPPDRVRRRFLRFHRPLLAHGQPGHPSDRLSSRVAPGGGRGSGEAPRPSEGRGGPGSAAAGSGPGSGLSAGDPRDHGSVRCPSEGCRFQCRRR